jgi:AraC-like DNA-binding protein
MPDNDQDYLDKAEAIMSDQQKLLSKEREESYLSPVKISFDNEKKTLLLDINRDALDLRNISEIAQQNGFTEKSEFHITVIGFKNGRAVNDALVKMSGLEKTNKLKEIDTLISSIDWRFILLSERFHISKDYPVYEAGQISLKPAEHRESYIQMVSMPGMTVFYEKINTALGTTLEVPPAHTTLYTNGSDKEKSKMGIGINTMAELQGLGPVRI